MQSNATVVKLLKIAMIATLLMTIPPKKIAQTKTTAYLDMENSMVKQT